MTPLILLPGMNLSAEFWAGCDCADTAIVVVPEGATLDEAVELLHERIDTPAILAGLSLGGILAMAYTRRHPENVAGLVLMATNAKGPTDAQVTGWQQGVEEITDTGDTRGFQEKLLPLLLGPDAQRDDEIVTATLSSATDPATLIDQLSMQQTRIDERPYLSQVSVPVEILAGRHDALCPVSNHDEIRDLIDGAVLEVSEHSGHLLALEDPAAVDAAVARIRSRLANHTKENFS